MNEVYDAIYDQYVGTLARRAEETDAVGRAGLMTIPGPEEGLAAGLLAGLGRLLRVFRFGKRAARVVEEGTEAALASRGGVQANRLAGQVGGNFLARTFGGRSQVTMQTSLGRRVLDNLAEGIARESKVGRTSLRSSVRGQIAKDAELLNSGRLGGVEWHFFPGKTGVGPTAPLREALEDAGFGIVIH